MKWSTKLCIHGVICQGDYVSGQEGLHVSGIGQCQTNRETNITKMFYTVSFVFSWLSKLEMNKMAHIVYGNRQNRGKGITCVYWNKGPSFLKNKRQDIKQIIQDHKPHILGLGEANFKSSHDIEDVVIQGTWAESW